MTVLQALGRGARELNRERRILLVYYAAATLPALAAAAAAMTLPFNSLGHSTWATALGQNLDVSWIAEQLAQSSAAMLPVAAALIGLAVLGRIVQLFLLGGTLAAFGLGEPFTPGSFFAGCGRYFWRLVRLALFSLIFFAVAMAIGAGLNAAGNKIWGEGSEAAPIVHWTWFRLAVTACLLGLCSLALDYAAIRLVVEDSRKSVRAYLEAFRLIGRAPLGTLGLGLVLWAIALLVLAGYFAVSSVLPETSLGLVIVLFAIRQVAVMVRACSRLLFYSAQCAMYADLRPAPAPEAEPAPALVTETPEPEVALEPAPPSGASGEEPPPAHANETPS